MLINLGRCLRIGMLAALLAQFAAGKAAADPNPATIHSDRGAWPLYRQWNEAEVAHFEKWINHIYTVKSNGDQQQRLAKIERVLTDPEINLLLAPDFLGSPSNPQLDEATLRAIHNILDCAKLATALPAYYSYRRGLPWMIGHIRSGDGGDIRTSAFNVAVGSATSFDYDEPGRFIRDAITAFCTGNYRVNPDEPYSELSDTVPIAITRQHLRPGCLFYLDGHVMMVADLDQYGSVYFMDSTTSSSRDIHTHNSLNAVTGITPRQTGKGDALDGCYRGFRTYRWPMAVTDADGLVQSIRRRTDEEMRAFGYSTEQYAVLEKVIGGGLVEGGVKLDNFHDFLRLRLRTADKIRPFELVENYAGQLVAAFEERERCVQDGWREVQNNGPVVFPEGSPSANVFNAGDRWGRWSTAALDADLRAQYFRLVDDLDSAISWLARMPQYVEIDDLRGRQSTAGLALRLIHVKNRVFANSFVSYTNSEGRQVPLSLLDLERRLFDLSFDPNHPPELRWGARPGSLEARTAKATATPLPDGTKVAMADSYAKQAYYRTLTHREPGESFLKTMFTEGFPTQSRFDERLGVRWQARETPPLVPHYAPHMQHYAWNTAAAKR